mmetsp:Transcript_19567/g.47230  ORF Transcript_19567/g.47230 Transcript_19567/m.47230 type:complete len:97 (-) Transcript_19567:1069-1359(-)
MEQQPRRSCIYLDSCWWCLGRSISGQNFVLHRLDRDSFDTKHTVSDDDTTMVMMMAVMMILPNFVRRMGLDFVPVYTITNESKVVTFMDSPPCRGR